MGFESGSAARQIDWDEVEGALSPQDTDGRVIDATSRFMTPLYDEETLARLAASSAAAAESNKAAARRRAQGLGRTTLHSTAITIW